MSRASKRYIDPRFASQRDPVEPIVKKNETDSGYAKGCQVTVGAELPASVTMSPTMMHYQEATHLPTWKAAPAIMRPTVQRCEAVPRAAIY